MANTTLHWNFREVMSEFRDGGRLAVWLCYLLHANSRSRAWPSVETIVAETGWSSAMVVEAKKWLVDHGAIIPIPYNKRMGEETSLHPRTAIMEITGIININGSTHQILYANRETNILASKILPTNTEVTTTTGDNDGQQSQPSIIRVWEQESRTPITPIIADELHDLVDTHGYETVVDAIKEAVTTTGPGQFGMKYVNKILTRWAREGRNAPKPDPMERKYDKVLR